MMRSQQAASIETLQSTGHWTARVKLQKVPISSDPLDQQLVTGSDSQIFLERSRNIRSLRARNYTENVDKRLKTAEERHRQDQKRNSDQFLKIKNTRNSTQQNQEKALQYHKVKIQRDTHHFQHAEEPKTTRADTEKNYLDQGDKNQSHGASHAVGHVSGHAHPHSEKLPVMKSAAFKLDDERPFGNVKIYEVEPIMSRTPGDSSHKAENKRGPRASTGRKYKAKNKKFDPNDMLLDNNIIFGGGQDIDDSADRDMEQLKMLDQQKHSILLGDQKGLFEFHSVKYQNLIEPPKVSRDEDGKLIIVDREQQQKLQNLDQIFIKEYEKTNSQVIILQDYNQEQKKREDSQRLQEQKKMSQDYIQRVKNSKNAFKSKFTLQNKRSKTEELIKQQLNMQTHSITSQQIAYQRQSLSDKLLHLILLSSSIEVGYIIALKLINKPHKQKFEYPPYPCSDLIDEKVAYSCHHSVRDQITPAQLDALKAISRKLKEEMMKEAVQREVIRNKAREYDKLFVNMTKNEQEEYLQQQYEMQLRKYLQISSRSLNQQIMSKKQTDAKEKIIKDKYFQQLSKLSLQLRMNSELFEDKNHGMNPNVGMYQLQKAGEHQHFCLYQDLNHINEKVEQLTKQKIEKMAEAHIKVDPLQVKIKIMKSHQIGCSIKLEQNGLVNLYISNQRKNPNKMTAMHTFQGRKNPMKFNQIFFSPCSDESTLPVKYTERNDQLNSNLDAANENCVQGYDHSEVPVGLLSEDENLVRFLTGFNNDMIELAKEIISRNKELEEQISEFLATYRPIEELLREQLMKNTYGRLWITIEALTDNCSGKITVNSMVQNIQKMLEFDKVDERTKQQKKMLGNNIQNNNKSHLSSSVDRSLHHSQHSIPMQSSSIQPFSGRNQKSLPQLVTELAQQREVVTRKFKPAKQQQKQIIQVTETVNPGSDLLHIITEKQDVKKTRAQAKRSKSALQQNTQVENNEQVESNILGVKRQSLDHQRQSIQKVVFFHSIFHKAKSLYKESYDLLMSLGNLNLNQDSKTTTTMQTLRMQFEQEDKYKTLQSIKPNSGEEHPMKVSTYTIGNKVNIQNQILTKRLKLNNVNFILKNRQQTVQDIEDHKNYFNNQQQERRLQALQKRDSNQKEDIERKELYANRVGVRKLLEHYMQIKVQQRNQMQFMAKNYAILLIIIKFIGILNKLLRVKKSQKAWKMVRLIMSSRLQGLFQKIITRRVSNKALLPVLQRDQILRINHWKYIIHAFQLQGYIIMNKMTVRKSKAILGDYLQQTLVNIYFLKKIKTTFDSILYIQSKFHNRLNRNRRKKQILRNYWDLIVKSCKDLPKEEGKAFVQKFNGHKFYLMGKHIRAKTINRIIEEQEHLYVKRLIAYQSQTRSSLDPKIRLAARAMVHFSINTIFKRRLYYEDNLIKNKVYEAMRALRKNKFASFKNETLQYNKANVQKIPKKHQIVRSQSETKHEQIAMQRKLQAFQSFQYLSQGPVIQKQKNSKSAQKKQAQQKNLLNEHQQLSTIKNQVFVRDVTRFDQGLTKEQIKLMINQVESEEERKKQMILFDQAAHLAKLREQQQNANDDFADILLVLHDVCRQNGMIIPDPEFIIEFETMIMYMSRAYRQMVHAQQHHHEHSHHH